MKDELKNESLNINQEDIKKSYSSPHKRQILGSLVLAGVMGVGSKFVDINGIQNFALGGSALLAFYAIKSCIDYLGFQSYKSTYPDKDHNYDTYLMSSQSSQKNH